MSSLSPPVIITEKILSAKNSCQFRTRQLLTVYYFPMFCIWNNKGYLCFSLFHSALKFTVRNLTSFCHVTHTPCCIHLYFWLLLQDPIFTHSLLITPNFGLPYTNPWFLNCQVPLHDWDIISPGFPFGFILTLFYYTSPLIPQALITHF